MKKEEFASVLPKELSRKYSLFEFYQSVACCALFEFDRICRNNNFQYFLAWGTLLGAIRDKGPIPWDYDADVFIKYSDRDKILNVLQSQLDDEYYCECPQTNPKCSNLFIRIAKRGISSTIAHLDVFFLVQTSADEIDRDFHREAVYRVSMARTYRNINPFSAAKGNPLVFCKAIYRILANIKNTNSKTEEEYEKLCSMYAEEGSNLLICGDRESTKHIFNASVFDNVTDVQFDDRLLMAPIGYEELLKQLFGNYTAYPSVEQQIKEYEHAVRRFEYYEKNKKRERFHR